MTDHTLTIAEVEQAASRHVHRSLVMASLLAVLLVGGVATAVGIDRAFPSKSLWRTRPFLGLYCCSPFVVAALGAILHLRRCVKKDPAARCPRCGQPLIQTLTLLRLTGNCSHCGRRVILEAGSR